MASLTTNQQQLQPFAYANLTFEHCENLSEIHSYVENEDWGKNLSILIDYLNFTCSNTFHLHNLKVPNPEGNGKSVDDSELLKHFNGSENDIHVIIDSGLCGNFTDPIYLCFKGDTISSLKLASVGLHKDLAPKYPNEIFTNNLPQFAETYYLLEGKEIPLLIDDYEESFFFFNREWRNICFTTWYYDSFEEVVDNIYNQANSSLLKHCSRLIKNLTVRNRMQFFQDNLPHFKDNAIQIVIQKENLSLVFHTIFPFYLLSEELDDPDCCLEINDKNEVIGLRSIEESYALARRNGRIALDWLLKAFNKVCLQIPLGGQSQRPTATPVKATSRFKVTPKRTRDYKDQLYEYIKQHPRQEMFDKPSNAWGCTWPDFKQKYRPVLPKDFSLSEIGNYDARFKVTPKQFKKGYSNFVQLTLGDIPNVAAKASSEIRIGTEKKTSRWDSLKPKKRKP
jgi:hypothetical protein